MTARRVACSARPIFRDRHLAVGAWYTVTTPDGTVYEFCSGCCLLYFALYGPVLDGVEAAANSGGSVGEAA